MQRQPSEGHLCLDLENFQKRLTSPGGSGERGGGGGAKFISEGGLTNQRP